MATTLELTTRTSEGAPGTKNEYARLKAIVQDAGLFESQGVYYGVKLAYTLGLFAIGIALLFLLSGWARVLIAAPYLAFVCAQLAFLSHDLGHKQIYQSNRVNNW